MFVIFLTGYLFFYFNIKGWKLTVEQYLDDKKKKEDSRKMKDEKRYESFIRESAESIFQQYLGDLNCDTRSEINTNHLVINLELRKKLGTRIQSESISQHWFDDVQKELLDILNTEFLTKFSSDSSFSKMLIELEESSNETGETRCLLVVALYSHLLFNMKTDCRHSNLTGRKEGVYLIILEDTLKIMWYTAVKSESIHWS